MEPQKVLTALHELKASPLISRLKVVKKMLDILDRWDGDPETLDLEAFTEDELFIASEEIQDHEEYWRNQPLQIDNSCANIVTSIHLPAALLSLPARKKKVTYI